MNGNRRTSTTNRTRLLTEHYWDVDEEKGQVNHV